VPYETANGTLTADAVEQSPVASGFPASRQDRLLRTAERIVRKLAPPPDPVTDDYRQAASDTEVQVFGFLATTNEGVEASDSLSGVSSTSYRAYEEAVRPLVREAMGDYYSLGSSTAYIGAWPY
jgi:hypothetical protein